MTNTKKPDVAVSITLTPKMQLGLFVLWMEKNPKADLDHMTTAKFREILHSTAQDITDKRLESLTEEQMVKKFDYAPRLRGIVTLP